MDLHIRWHVVRLHMQKWMQALTKIHHYGYSLLGVTGVVATVLFARPGTHSVGVGPVSFDLYWFLLVMFGTLLVL